LWRLVWYDQEPGFHNVIRGNLIYDNMNEVGVHSDGNGIIIDNSGDNPPPTLIENNIVFDNGGKGIQVYSAGNVTIRNNSCYHNSKDPAL
jgi:parallel beta-helix repeat protein